MEEGEVNFLSGEDYYLDSLIEEDDLELYSVEKLIPFVEEEEEEEEIPEGEFRIVKKKYIYPQKIVEKKSLK